MREVGSPTPEHTVIINMNMHSGSQIDNDVVVESIAAISSLGKSADCFTKRQGLWSRSMSKFSGWDVKSLAAGED